MSLIVSSPLSDSNPEPGSTDEMFKSSAYLTDAYLLNEASKHSALQSAAPFNLAFGTEGQFYSWLEQGGNEMRLKRFGHAMRQTMGNISQTIGEGGYSKTSSQLWPAKRFPRIRLGRTRRGKPRCRRWGWNWIRVDDFGQRIPSPEILYPRSPKDN